MGTQIERHQLKASDFGGKEGANDLLSVTRPDLVEDIHARYLSVGCDVTETNTFGSSRLKLDEYGLGHRTYEVNFRAAILARRAAERFSTPDHPRFVAGSIGPTGMLPSSTDPALGNITGDALERIFYEQARALVEGVWTLFWWRRSKTSWSSGLRFLGRTPPAARPCATCW